NVAFVEQYLMMAMAFGGLVYAYRTGAHVAVKSIYSHLPVRARKVVIIISSAIVVVCCVWMGIAGTEFAHRSFAMGEQPMPGASELPLPTFLWKTIMPLSAFLCAILAAIDLVREISSPHNTVTTDYADDTDFEATEG